MAHAFSKKYDVVEFDIAQWRIDELDDHGCNVDGYDPWVDVKDVEQKNYTFITDSFESNKMADKKYDAIITAVGHQSFKELKRSQFEAISTDESVLIDIKGIVENLTGRL